LAPPPLRTRPTVGRFEVFTESAGCENTPTGVRIIMNKIYRRNCIFLVFMIKPD